MLLNKTTARAYYGYVNNKLTPFSSAIFGFTAARYQRGQIARVSQIVKMASACAWDGKLHRIYLHPIIFALSWLSRRLPVRFRWLNLLMNVLSLFAEDDEVQIIEVRN